MRKNSQNRVTNPNEDSCKSKLRWSQIHRKVEKQRKNIGLVTNPTKAGDEFTIFFFDTHKRQILKNQ